MVKRDWSVALAMLTGLLAFDCKPEFAGRFSSIGRPTLLAVRSTPAQAKPGDMVSFQSLVASPTGSITDPALGWAFCGLAKPISEINDVTTRCFEQSTDQPEFSQGPKAAAKLPINGCAQFGPDIPTPKAGEPPGRPSDADATGGYYQPIVVTLGSSAGTLLQIAQERLLCGLAGASATQALDFQNRSKPNENPKLERLTVVGDPELPLLEEGTACSDATSGSVQCSVNRGQSLVLRAAWPQCPTAPNCGDGVCFAGEDVQNCAEDCKEPHGCGGSEPYVYLDPAIHQLVERRESIRVSWFASDGEFAQDHTGRREDEANLQTSDNTWTAPGKPGRVWIWVVLRDDRGGADWKSFEIDVQ